MNNDQLQDCVNACYRCHDVCKTTFFQHCLPMGGRHVEPQHISLMVDCMEICHVSANFMLRDSERHHLMCASCAIICDACAESCEALDTREMHICAEACRACAKSCREIRADTYIPGQADSLHHVDHVM